MIKILLKVPAGVFSAFFTLVVLYLCLVPQPVKSAGLLDFPGADKVVHFLMFFAIAASYLFDFGKTAMPPGRLGRGKAIAVTAVAIALGGAIEVAQELMGLGRSMDIFDFLADAAGAVCAMALMQMWLLNKLHR